jgi:hypothetical protein
MARADIVVKEIHPDLDLYWQIPLMIKNHFITITKNRTIKITGDTDHLSIHWLINEEFANIDKPREYDFQKENVHEEDFLMSLLRYSPDFLFYTDEEKKKIENAIAGNEWYTIKEPGYDRPKCYDCVDNLVLSFKGNEVKVSGTKPCEHHRQFTVEIDFPTGNVVYADWPDRFSEARDAGIIEKNDEESINYLRGRHARSDEFAAQQIFHHFVGNSCPHLFYNKTTDVVQIGGGGYDEDTDEMIPPNGSDEVGYFCTDLWWVTMIDKKYYDQIVKKLSKKRDEKYYKNDVNIATIKPGRYRFTCNAARGDDDNGVPYVTAEWIGEASNFVPAYNTMADSRLMTLNEAIQFSDYSRGNSKFGLIDYVFNTNGNGIRSKGEFQSHFKVCKELPACEEHNEEKINLEKEFIYPNFRKEYSTIYQIKIKEFPTDWLEGVLWYYQICAEYFMGDAQSYSNAYPGKEKKREEEKPENILKSWEKQYRKEGMTDEEFHKAVSKAMDCEFDGDVVKHLTLRWTKEKARCLEFCNETVKYVQKELDKRKK